MKTHHLCCALLCASAFYLTGCSNDTPSQLNAPDSGRVTLRLSLASVGTPTTISRADEPKLEYGRDIENAIADALIIVYDAPLNSGNGNVVQTIYLPSLTLENRYDTSTQTLQGKYCDNGGNQQNITNGVYRIANEYSQSQLDPGNLENGSTYYAIAIANVGDMSSTFSSMTVSQLRDYVYTGPLYTENYAGVASNPTNLHIGKFAMTAVNEVKITMTPYADRVVNLGTFMVQRLAARIDLAFGQLVNTDEHSLNDKDPNTGEFLFDVETRPDGSYRFPIYSENIYQSDGSSIRLNDVFFYLTGIEIVNAVNSGSYLIEHSNGTPRYLGNEGNWASGYPSLFVESASSKTVATRDLTVNKTKSSYSVIHPNILAWQGSGIFGTYSILGYVGENTFSSYNADNAYTALRLSGRIEGLSTGHLTGTESAHDNNVSVEYKLRHSYGAVNTSNPMVYGVVRNTVYRSYVKFYANGEGVYARFYYYGDDGNGAFTESDTNNTQLKYTDIPFYSNILEFGSGSSLND